MAEQTAVQVPDAPAPTGAYSQAVVADGWCYASGQVGWDAAGRGLDSGVAAQTRQAVDNLAAVLAGAGASWRDVVRTNVYLRDLADVATFDAAYGEALAAHGVTVLPARTTVGAVLFSAVEIDVVARTAEHR